MMPIRAALFVLLALIPLRAPAQDVSGPNIDGKEASGSQDEFLVTQAKYRINGEPAFREALAERIFNSKLRPHISKGRTRAAVMKDIHAWIKENQDSAASVAVGLAADDEAGNAAHEDRMVYQRKNDFVFNPDSRQGIFGRLKKKSSDSKLMNLDAEMADEEKQEIIRGMFEGDGLSSGNILTQKDGGGTVDGEAGFGDSGFYDRLSRANLTGYSPQVMAIQSALNSRRAPGAPKLIETGKLDYPTLSYPAYSMRYDIGKLDTRLRWQRNYELAKFLGLEKKYSPADLKNPELTAKLEAKLKDAPELSPRLKTRAQHLERARAALSDFARTALRSKDPKRINPGLLRSLGSKQKEAARWITLASLEEDLMRIEAEEGFLSPELLKSIEALPLAKDAISAYKRRGGAFAKKIALMKSNDQKAQKLLLSSRWLSSLAAVDDLIAENAHHRKNLSRDIRNYVSTPYRLHTNFEDKPGWRKTADIYIKRFLPTISYSRRLKRMTRRFSVYKDIFIRIAQGDLDGAHRMISSREPRS